jgi:hypothetical protein
MSKEFKKEVEKGLSAICDKIGFKKKQCYFIKPMDDNVIAILHFGMVTHASKGHIYINVGVGVSYKNAEKLLYFLLGRDKVIFDHTILQQIGYLMPENTFKEWDFVEDANNTRVFEDLLKSIQAYGFPYQEKMRCFDNLLQSFERRDAGILYIARDRYLPILYYLKGDKQRGVQAIEEAIERQKQPVSEETKEQLKKMAGAGGQVIIGSGVGQVDPEYLMFAERYRLL